MGNECCSSRQKKQESDFSEKEREGLQELYNELTLVKTRYVENKPEFIFKAMRIMK